MRAERSSSFPFFTKALFDSGGAALHTHDLK